MKKIILSSIICLAIFTSCSKRESTYFRFPNGSSYSFELNSNNFIESVNLKSDNSEPIFLERSLGVNYYKVIDNPTRKIIDEEGRVVYNEEVRALKNIGFELYTYKGFTDSEYKFVYQLDCRKNSDAQNEKINSFYIFSKDALTFVNSGKKTDFIRDDKKSHICLDSADGKIYLVTDFENTPNFVVLEKSDYLISKSGYNKIEVTSSDEEFESNSFFNIVIKDFEVIGGEEEI